MPKEDSIRAFIEECGTGDLAAYLISAEAAETGLSADELRASMAERWDVMRASAAAALESADRSLSGLTGGMGARLYAADRALPGGETLRKAAAYALAIAEYNAQMGRIVAAPTAGACGILPAALLTAIEQRAGHSPVLNNNIPQELIIDALFCAAAVGRVIASRASVSGAQGGCQAECGSAAAMTAAALTILYGGTAAEMEHAVAFALMNTMGLVCDPVGGFVEIPCVFRNVMGVGLALSCADMALAGIKSIIPADEIIDAMREVGDSMPAQLKETGLGGCAACPTARACARG
ncbi:MAG: L-serine ammonia-lyase, iron-sulfur-dependent, subunit alpha [Oscillospiraceae bacterium]|jgi:L-serine dehydratase|nr:L-serine ammonia-lyase, iron-sulfur-dependent, subunit alpha [Oscillospiraceae bacterium]